MFYAAGKSKHNAHLTDGAAAINHHGIIGLNIGFTQRKHSNTRRLKERALLKADGLGKLIHALLGSSSILGKATVAAEAVNLQLLAVVRIACLALIALTAVNMSLDCNAVAHGNVLDLAADFGDNAAALMTNM